MFICLNQRNATFVGKKDILQKFANRKVLEINLVKEEEKIDLDEDSTNNIFNVYKLSSRGKQDSYRINVQGLT